VQTSLKSHILSLQSLYKDIELQSHTEHIEILKSEILDRNLIMIMTDPTGIITDVSKGFEILSGYAKDATYKAFFGTLKERGIEKVDLIISDGHKGIKKAASESFRCLTAFQCAFSGTKKYFPE
jgi:hypothetical protein